MYPYSHSGSGYNLNSFLPHAWRGWDDYIARLSRYEVLDGYYHNVAYHWIVNFSQSLKTQERLYKHVRGVYNPIMRLVEAYVAKVWGGTLDMEDAQTGAIPIKSDNPRVPEAVMQLWRDSHWGQKKSLSVRNGAKYGDGYLKVVDDIAYQQVRLEVIDPQMVKDCRVDSAGKIHHLELEYFIRNPMTHDLSTYRETITPEHFVISYDGKMMEYQSDMPGMMGMSDMMDMRGEYPNPYGFVPAVHTQHTDVGLHYGAFCGHGSLHKINELNDIASNLNDAMRKQVNMPMFTFGQRVGIQDLGSDKSTQAYNQQDSPKKDSIAVLEMDKDARVEFGSPTLNLTAGLENIEAILAELERDFPELALHRIREGGNLTAPGVKSAYDDAISRFAEARGNYDSGLVEAQSMALAIGGERGYTGYEGFSLADLENGNLDHSIGERPVIKDTLSKADKLDYTLRGIQANAPRTFYIEVGWSAQEADELMSTSQNNQNSFLMAQQRIANETPPPDDEDMMPAEMATARENTAVNETDMMMAQRMLERI